MRINQAKNELQKTCIYVGVFQNLKVRIAPYAPVHGTYYRVDIFEAVCNAIHSVFFSTQKKYLYFVVKSVSVM